MLTYMVKYTLWCVMKAILWFETLKLSHQSIQQTVINEVGELGNL